jgi:AraC-like DNA-binding protein
MTVDRLESLLQRLSPSARVFNAGKLCGIHQIDPSQAWGQLHLVRSGEVRVLHAGSDDLLIEQPSLLFYPLPLAHRFVIDSEAGADLVCAHVSLGEGASNPIAQALPPVVCLPLAGMSEAAGVLQLLFEEASEQRCGRQLAMDRLFEVLLIHLLRHLMEHGRASTGLLSGLAHPQLRRALTAMHERPGHDWTLESLAEVAGMSRSAFINAFRNTIGCTPGVYLARWRVLLAQMALRRGQPLKLIVEEVGYGSEAALSRAFKAHSGMSPRAWKAEARASALA